MKSERTSLVVREIRVFIYFLLLLFHICRLPLKDMKKKVLRNLKVLEQQNLVSSKNDYQEIVNAIAKVRVSQLFLLVCTFVYTEDIFYSYFS